MNETPSAATTSQAEPQPDYKAQQRAGRFHMVTVVRPLEIPMGQAVKTPGGAIYARSSNGQSLIRLNKSPKSKKQRRLERAAAKAAMERPIEQIQAELGGEA